jgi:hypothetical protein
MRIGILGTGVVGQALGTGFAARGHDVMMGSREASNAKATSWAAKAKGKTGTFADAAKHGEVIVVATVWDGTENALQLAAAENLAGKVVIDATNPLVVEPGAPPRLALGHTDSGGEQVQRWIPDARVVKAFNMVGNAFMVNPDFECGPPDMFIAGNDAEAKQVVTKLLNDFGWKPVDFGGIEGARLLEPLCIVWVTYGIVTGGWNHAIKMVKTSQ